MRDSWTQTTKRDAGADKVSVPQLRSLASPADCELENQPLDRRPMMAAPRRR
jgi:hypothetical protein